MEVADKINVVRDVVDEIALHQLHVVAVEQELDGRRIDRLDEFKALVGRVEPVALVVIHGVEGFKDDRNALFFRDLGRALQVFQQNKLLRILKAPLQIARQADKGLAAEFLADSDGSFYIRLYSLPREIHADGPRLVQAAGRDGDARVG